LVGATSFDRTEIRIKNKMKLPNLAFLTRVSKSSLGKRPLIAFGGAVNNSFGVKTIFVFNFFDKS
jgi:hypothetical protein